MSDTKKALITVARSLLAKPKDFCGRDVMADLVAALEHAEARAENAEEELEDYRGIESDLAAAERKIEELRNVLYAIARLVGVFEHCQELGDDMGTMSLDAVQGLLAEKQKAEAENTRLRERLESSLDKIADIQENREEEGACHACGICAGCPEDWQPTDDHNCRVMLELWADGEPLPWEGSARQAVAAGEETCQK